MINLILCIALLILQPKQYSSIPLTQINDYKTDEFSQPGTEVYFIVNEREMRSSFHVQNAKEIVEITYLGKIMPPQKHEYTAIRGGKKYSGILSLESYKWKGNQTIAVYSGFLSESE